MKQGKKRLYSVIGALSVTTGVLVGSLQTHAFFARKSISLPGKAQVIFISGSSVSMASPFQDGGSSTDAAELATDHTTLHRTRGAQFNTTGLIRRVSTSVIDASLGTFAPKPTRVILLPTVKSYSQVAKASFPGNEVATVVTDTGGFTNGSTVYIPSYKYQDSAYLVNTLTHELTHATLNEQGIGSKLPSWLNEGFAWYNGITAQQRLQPNALQTLNAELLPAVSTAVKSHSLLPLSITNQRMLSSPPKYNVEYVDFLAVQALIDGYGLVKFRHFLDLTPELGATSSFQKVYGMGMNRYGDAFEHLL